MCCIRPLMAFGERCDFFHCFRFCACKRANLIDFARLKKSEMGRCACGHSHLPPLGHEMGPACRMHILGARSVALSMTVSAESMAGLAVLV